MAGYYGNLGFMVADYVDRTRIYNKSIPQRKIFYMNSAERRELRYRRRKQKRLEKVKERSIIYTKPEEIFSTESIVNGFKKVGKASHWKSSTKRFKAFVFTSARAESKALLNGTWRTKGVKEFDIIERGHPRHIQNVHISEKAVQSALSNECLIPIIRPSLIYDNGASLKGKGTDFALNRFDEHLRSFTKRYGRNGWIYFFDFEKYFDHIKHKRMVEILSSKVLRKEVIDVYLKILLEMKKGPIETSEGLGLGSQVFQISAIYYPNALDHLIKDQLGIKYYGRYMDDCYALFDNKEQLFRFLKVLRNKCDEIGLRLNKKKCQIIRLTKRFVFLKVRYYITDTLKIIKRINRSSKIKEKRRLRKLHELLMAGVKEFDEIRNEFHSWICGLTRGKSFHIICDMIEFFNRLFSDYDEYALSSKPKRRQRKMYHSIKYAIEFVHRKRDSLTI